MRAKAASRSCSLATFTGTIRRPRACAAVSMLGTSNEGFSGSSKTATMATLGTSSCNSSSRFAPSRLPPKNVTPVRFPPGRLRLATRPIFTGSSPTTNTIGTVGSATLTASNAGVLRTITAGLAAEQVGGEARQPIRLIVRPALLDSDVASVDEPFLAQAVAKLRHDRREQRSGRAAQQPDYRQPRLLRARRERPCRSCAAEKDDELSPFHSITSSAS